MKGAIFALVKTFWNRRKRDILRFKGILRDNFRIYLQQASSILIIFVKEKQLIRVKKWVTRKISLAI